jgi:hypothetical protein
MPKQPASLGDEEPAKFKLIQETFPPPKNRKELLRSIEQILQGGGVQKLLLKVGDPIRVTRAIKDEGTSDAAPQELQMDDVLEVALNVPMEEFLPETGISPYEYIFQGFVRLGAKQIDGVRLLPRMFITKQMGPLMKWLRVKSLTDICGVEVQEHKEMPENSLLFVGANATEVDEIRFSLKMVIEP